MVLTQKGDIGMHLKGFLIVLSGPSGAGKNTVMNAVVPTIPNISYSVSVTTRPPRSGEQEGADYFFVDDKTFDKLIDADELLEWAVFCGYRYGTPKSFVAEQTGNGKTVILDVDIQGAVQIRQRDPQAVLVFLLPPTWEELQRRLRARGKDAEETIRKRLEHSFIELKHIVDYDYYVINDDLDRAAARLRTIIQAEWCRVERADLDKLQMLWKKEGVRCDR